MKDIDWHLVAEVVGAGYGLTLLLLTFISLTTWIAGSVAQRFRHPASDHNSGNRSKQ